MGLFDALFEKKECNICGGEIGLLGNRKLEDGNLCKECEAKLSPWFDERRESTVAEIAEQLAYREENKKAVAAFNTTFTFGEYVKLLLDEDAGVFVVTSQRDLEKANPDVLKFTDVTGCDYDINERTDEITATNSEGKPVSYKPPRYRHMYDFYITIHVNNPYFDEISFRLNGASVEISDQMKDRDPSQRKAGYLEVADPEKNADYCAYREKAEEIKAVLLKARQDARDEAAAAAAPKAAVVCQYCGATTTPDASGCCEFCGGAVAD